MMEKNFPKSNGAIFSIGHSTQSLDDFISVLRKNEISVVVDVRSSPFSKFTPQFNKDSIFSALKNSEIDYLFFGEHLGARPEDPSCYLNGKVQYARLAAKSGFKNALIRLLKGAQNYRIALMCAEKEPLDCHRTILVSQALFESGCEVKHILHDGSLEVHAKTLDRLLTMMKVSDTDLFKSREELHAQALRKQESRIAHRKDGPGAAMDGD